MQKNIEFAQKRAWKHIAQDHHQIDISFLIELMGIDHKLDHKPEQLSGGERQRAAIVRALAIQPDILLMDEPLSALDGQRKQEILPFLEALNTEINIPILYVTHSADEIARLADQVVVFEQGRIAQQGSAETVFAATTQSIEPDQDRSVIISGYITDEDQEWQLKRFEFNGGKLWLSNSGHKNCDANQNLKLRIRAADISIALSKSTDSSILNSLAAIIVEIQPAQSGKVLVKLQCGETSLLASITAKSAYQLKLDIGQPVFAQIKSVAIVR